MHLLEQDDENVIEEHGLTKLVAKWKKGFNEIKDIDMDKQ
jgi:hypothetical protein